MFELILIYAELGQMLNKNGDTHIRGTEEFQPQFESEAEAIEEKDRLLNEFIYAAVIIKNLETDMVSQEYCNEELGPKFRQEKHEYYKWCYLPFYKKWFTPKPSFKYYDGKH